MLAVSSNVRRVACVAALAISVAACTRDNPKGPVAAATTPTTPMQAISNVPGTAIALSAHKMRFGLRDGSSVPMWGYCPTGSCGSGWAPGPTIYAKPGESLTITLTNELDLPTSVVILGQKGGGVGHPTKMEKPFSHPGQNATTFPSNGPVNPPGQGNAFVPPTQEARVRSFGTEVAAGGSTQLVWNDLKPGTYIYETGTLPSLEVPMGLYGVLVVTAGPTALSPGVAYPGINYDADVTMLFSEVDPVQNAAVDAAAAKHADISKRFNDPTCTADAPCYPPAVNYSPTYFLINGQSFDKTKPSNMEFDVPGAYNSGNVLLRLANAGSRTHVPALVGPPMSFVAEDGNRVPGNPRVLNEVLLSAGKTSDAIITPVKSTSTTINGYAPATYPLFDRALGLSSGNKPEGGMQAFILINHEAVQATGKPGAPGMLPIAATPTVVNDAFKVPFNTAIGGNVTTNDFNVTKVALGTAPTHGTVALNLDGSFTYAPTTGFSGTDTFTYTGEGAMGSATVTLTVAAQLTDPASQPVAASDSYKSSIATKLHVARPGVLANDSDPHNFPLKAGGVTGAACDVTLNADGSFDAVAKGSSTCQFQYTATNSQGTASAPATVSIDFGQASNLQVSVTDATNPTIKLADYRWTLQEDLTFKHDLSGTPSLSTRTIGTSFHRSHMPVVATGCVGPISCGSGQSVVTDPKTNARHTVTDAEAIAKQTTPDQVVLDPSKRYFISILPGDAAIPAGPNPPPSHTMSGAEIKPTGKGGWSPVQIKLQSTPLVPAQLSIYLYEDNAPTNGQNDTGEPPLGGFNIVLWDPAGRTGDPAGQQTYDASNMPLSNALLGTPGCPDDRNRQTNGDDSTTSAGHLVGVIYTCPNDPNEGTPAADPVKYALAGHALIKNLTPARYDVIAHPGAEREGAGEVWWQVETLEGTPAQDAFTGINEPTYFQEFGPPGPHVTIGFVNPGHVAAYAQANGLVGAHTIKGKITSQHMSHPSDVTLHDAGTYDLLSSTTCYVALNSQGGNGPAIATTRCDADGNFVLSGVPAGDYQVDVFDQWLDQIVQGVAVTVRDTTPIVDMGNIPVLSWFTQYDQNIYMDLNQNGVYDSGEPGISNVPLTVRYRNGSFSNRTLTDNHGNGILVELFPLFNWYVAEADTTRFKQTGVHIVVDGGGPVDTTGEGANLWSSKYATGEPSVRTEIPGAQTYGVQGFISQRNRIDWGRTPYAKHENGGIQGHVVYSSTRAFDDQRYDVQTIWEPLVPRVTVNLYRKETLEDGTRTLTLVDTTKTTSWDDFVNRVLGADDNEYMLGSDNLLRDPDTGALAPPEAYPPGKQVNLQCPGQKPTDVYNQATLGGDTKRCYDGWHNWNQVQAAPYDGLYRFPSHAFAEAQAKKNGHRVARASDEQLPPGQYVVEVVTPPGYEIVKEEDKNILIGDAFVAPVTQQFGGLTNVFILPDQATLGNANPNNPGTGDPGFQSNPTTNLGDNGYANANRFPPCVGNLHRVPDFLSLYPQAQQVAPFAGMDRPLCDRKLITLNDQMQANADFFIFTYVPAASNNTGIILDDASSEFNAAAPDFGEKASVPFVPISIKDFAGQEISRAYSDQWGAYNLMTPSSWLVNPPTPSGYGPNMLVTCMNDPGPIPDPNGTIDAATGQVAMVPDPAYNPSYSTFCYTNPFMPGQTTYLDTPVLPIAAFAAGYSPADCSEPDATPAIKRVDSSAGKGPWLPTSGGTLTIIAQGDQQVLNPAYAGPFAPTGKASERFLTRHYGFGSAPGRVFIGDTDITPATWANGAWTDGAITVAVPAGTQSGQLRIVTAAGVESIETVTVTVEDKKPTRVPGDVATIQAAIDAATPGDLILVDAGVYNELVIMWKPVRLQGVGAGSVIINAAKYPTSKLASWRPRINDLFAVSAVTGSQTGTSQVDPLPGQEITGGVIILEPTVLGSEEGAGITVLAKSFPYDPAAPTAHCSGEAASTLGFDTALSNFRCAPSRIDGISVTGGDAGGGIFVNGWAHGLEIANNRIYGNAGAFNGGVRVGIPYLQLEGLPDRDDSGRIAGFGFDVNVRIHHNAVTRNGTVEAPVGQGGAGGGISVCTGSDNYSVDHNFVCGNYTAADGAGIGHIGFSQGGTIASNQVLFNQSFQQTQSAHGGGIMISGEPPVAGAVTLGTGDVTVDRNLIRGNLAESGQGGGLRVQQANGADVDSSDQSSWHHVTITNNMIVNNVAAWAGAGVSISDALNISIVNNTIASNDNTGTAGVLLNGNKGVGRPAASGIVVEPTSAALLGQFSDPADKATYAVGQPTPLSNNILWHNRSFYYSGDGRLCIGNSSADTAACVTMPDQSATGQCVGGTKYWDLGVLGDSAAGTTTLVATASIQSGGTDPGLVGLFCNGSRSIPELPAINYPNVTKNMQVAAVADEGNNYVSVKFGPLFVESPLTSTVVGDYRISASGGAFNAGVAPAPDHDFFGKPRPVQGRYDIGAHEVQ